MNPIEEVIQEMLDGPVRYPVLRTKYTEERQPLSDSRRFVVLRRDHFRCVICDKGGLLEVDHIIPWSAGGSDDMDNLRTLCRDCNQERSNFRYPIDEQRRLSNGHECVYCNSHLVGEPDLTSIYCVQCNKKAPGIPNDPFWHPDVGDEPRPRVVDVVVSPEEQLERQTWIAELVARNRAPREIGMRDWTGSSVQIDALEVGCRYCYARAGDPCVAKDTGQPLKAFPAHTVRITAAAKASEEAVNG